MSLKKQKIWIGKIIRQDKHQHDIVDGGVIRRNSLRPGLGRPLVFPYDISLPKWIIFLLMVLTLVFGCGASKPYENALNSTLQIYLEKNDEWIFSGSASAVEIDKSTYILTAKHIVEVARHYGLGPEIKVCDIKRYCELVDISNAVLNDNDVALIPINTKFKVNKVAKSRLKVGDKIISSGYPNNRLTTQDGMVTGFQDGGVLLKIHVEPGSSGSPIFDKRGKIVAVLVAAATSRHTGFPLLETEVGLADLIIQD